MRFKKMVEKLEFLIPTVLLVIMTLVVCMQVFMRRVIGRPLSWPEEIARWCLIWITFGGISYGFAGGAFISVDFFVKRFFNNKYKQIKVFGMIITSLFFGLCTVSGLLFTISTIRQGTFMPVTRVPAAVSNIAIFVGSFLGVLRSTSSIFQEYKNN